jgi:SAM-dependent methyltransferase
MLTIRYEKLGVKAGDRLLDMGAGAGRHAFEALRRGAIVTALDYSLNDVRQAGSTLYAMELEGNLPPTATSACVNGDALRLPFHDSSFDRIICSEVMEHIPDDRGAAAELFRVLKPGGTIAVTVPSFGPELVNWALDSDYHAPVAVGGHVRIYRKSEISERLTTAGFTLNGTHRAHALHSPYWWLKCAVGVNNNDNKLVKKYHDLLVWDLMKKPAATQIPEKILTPVLGKSLIVYGTKPR